MPCPRGSGSTGETVDQVAESLHVGRRTVDNWVERFQERDGLDFPRGWPMLPARAGLATAGMASIPGLPRSSTRTRGNSVITRRSGPHPCWGDTCGSIMTSRSRKDGQPGHRTAGIRWKRPRHQLALRPDTWRQSKGG